MVWFFDIDGTLIDNIKAYYEAWYKFATKRGVTWKTYDYSKYSFQEIFHPDSEVYTMEFETSEEFADFYIDEVFEGAIETINKLKEMGDTVFFLTSRDPFYNVALTPKIRELFNNVYPEKRGTVKLSCITEQWAISKGLNPRDIIFAEDKVSIVEQYKGNCICVDDSPQKIKAYVDAGIYTLIMDAEYNKDCGNNKGIRFSRYDELLAIREKVASWIAARKEHEKMAFDETREELLERVKRLTAQNKSLEENDQELKTSIAGLKKELELATEELSKCRAREHAAKHRAEGNTPVQGTTALFKELERCKTEMARMQKEIERKDALIENFQKENLALRKSLEDWVFKGRKTFGTLKHDYISNFFDAFEASIGLFRVPNVEQRKRYFGVIKKLASAFGDRKIPYCVSRNSALLMYGVDTDMTEVTFYVPSDKIDNEVGALLWELDIPYSIRRDTPEASAVATFSIDGVRVKVLSGSRAVIHGQVIDNLFLDKTVTKSINGISVQSIEEMKKDARILGDEGFARKVNTLSIL